jgi:prolycopene isomerase
MYEVIVIGAGLSGLTAGALLCKKGIKVAVIDKNYMPGGSCGIFKREGVTFDQGSAMLFGFGEKGFNAHRFVFNCLEQPIDMIKHDLLYVMNFNGHKIRFYADLDLFKEELSSVFPDQKDNIVRFYDDMSTMYQHVLVETPSYTTPDENDLDDAKKGFKKHPLSYIKFLSYLNISAEKLLKRYFDNDEIIKFFDKLTSTYCYTTTKESPAILASVMFVDNHTGGSYYPAGSTLFLPGLLEKSIEENGGDMILEKEVTKILFENSKPVGVELNTKEKIYADNIIFSGTVWDLYGKLIDSNETTEKKRRWASNMVPTYPSVVLYCLVKDNCIPKDTQPVEMLVGNVDQIDESEVTAYIFSIDDKTLCEEGYHVIAAIGPTFVKWSELNEEEYITRKEQEKERLIKVLERRFPDIRNSLVYTNLATSKTLERYLNKKDGAVAGPKQKLGQHMFKRQHTKSQWDNLYCCGESTVMGTGTPTVTTSGISAANAILKKLGKEKFKYDINIVNYVNVIGKPVKNDDLFYKYDDETAKIVKKAFACQLCENPTCAEPKEFDARGIMRRVCVGNFVGAKKLINEEISVEKLKQYEKMCIEKKRINKSVEISVVIEFLRK